MKTKSAILLIISLTAVTISFVWTRLRIIRYSYEIHELEKQERNLQERISQLNLKANQSRSPARLESLARTRFEMKPALSSQIILMKETTDAPK